MKRRIWKLALWLAAYLVLMSAMFRVPTSTVSLDLYNTYVDHASHTSTAVLFFYVSWSLYTTPIKRLCPIQDTPLQRSFAKKNRVNPRLLCDLKARQGRRPLFINWRKFAKPYPPGMLLYAAPEAMLYEWTSLSFRTINLLTIAKYLLGGFFLLWALGWTMFGGEPVSASLARWMRATNPPLFGTRVGDWPGCCCQCLRWRS